MNYFHKIIALIILHLSTLAYGDICADNTSSLSDIMRALNTTCSEKSIRLASQSSIEPIASHQNVTDKQMCTCLNIGKEFNKVRVLDDRKDTFVKWEYDQTIREKLKASFNDMVVNFSKFNNIILTKEHLGNLIDENKIKQAGGFCNIDTLTKRIGDLQNIQRTPACPSPKGFMYNRVNEIFGTYKMSEIPKKLKKNLNEIDKNSCMPQSMFLNLRSSSGAAGKGFDYLLEDPINLDHNKFQNHFNHPSVDQKGPLKDLLTYDVFFNLAYRDQDFAKDLKNRIDERKKEDGRLFDIYNDKDALILAYTSLNRTCNELSKNLKTFLCASEYPKMEPATMSLHMEDYFADDKSVQGKNKEYMTDYFTWEYSSCNPARLAPNTSRSGKKKSSDLNLAETSFNEYIEKSILIKNTTKPTLENEEGSDYSKFNASFCGNRKGEKISVGDLSGMTKEFIAKFTKNGKDVSALFADNSLAEKLGFKLDLTKDPIQFIVTSPEDIKNGLLPNISEEKWNLVMGKALKEQGMGPDEIYQLYTIIEMQTNRKFTEMEDLKYKLVKENDTYKNLTLTEIDRLVNTKGMSGEEVTKINDGIRSRLVASGHDPASSFLASDFHSVVNNRDIAQKRDQVEQLEYAQDLFFNERSVADIKSEAIAYTGNNSTYANDYTGIPGDGVVPGSKVPKPPIQWGKPSTGGVADPIVSGPVNGNLRQANSGGDDSNGSSKPSGNLNAGNTSSSRSSSTRSTSSSSLTPTSSPKPTDSSSAEQSPTNPTEKVASKKTPTSQSTAYHKSQNDSPDESPSISKAKNDSYVKKIKNDASKITDELNRLRNASAARRAKAAAARKSSSPSQDSQGNSFASNNPSFKNSDEGSELSSNTQTPKDVAGNDPTSELVEPGTGKARGPASAGAGGGPEAAPASGGGGAGGPVGSAASASLSGLNLNLPAGGRELTDKEKEEAERKRLNLASFEHPKLIPYGYIDFQGSIADVVVMLGLEGKRFKTIEMVSEFDKKTQKQKENFYVRTFDFVPQGEFEDFKTDFETKEAREIAYKAYFSYPRSKSSMKASKKYASATREISKEQISYEEYIKLKYDILTEDHIRDILNKFNSVINGDKIVE